MEKKLEKNVEEALKLSELSHIFEDKFLASLNQAEYFLEIHNKVTAFCEKLFAKYSIEEVRKRQLFHLISGSSGMSHQACPYLDFEGDDSIEKFIREL